MDYGDEAEMLRIDDEDYDERLTREELPGDEGAISQVAQTKQVATYPTAAGAYYGMTSAGVFGPEVEGGAGTITTGQDTFYALNIGSAVPPVGTNVLIIFVDERWIFRYDG